MNFGRKKYLIIRIDRADWHSDVAVGKVVSNLCANEKVVCQAAVVTADSLLRQEACGCAKRVLYAGLQAPFEHYICSRIPLPVSLLVIRQAAMVHREQQYMLMLKDWIGRRNAAAVVCACDTLEVRIKVVAQLHLELASEYGFHTYFVEPSESMSDITMSDIYFVEPSESMSDMLHQYAIEVRLLLATLWYRHWLIASMGFDTCVVKSCAQQRRACINMHTWHARMAMDTHRSLTKYI